VRQARWPLALSRTGVCRDLVALGTNVDGQAVSRFAVAQTQRLKLLKVELITNPHIDRPM
jgi:hypothetical protein